MAINYYYYLQQPCKSCGRSYSAIHIGKSTPGWCFALHIIPELDINGLSDWVYLFNKRGSYIKNEFGEQVSSKDMVDIITKREPFENTTFPQSFLSEQSAYQRADGLLCRDYRECTYHGEGTWDCVKGNFE